MGDPPPPALAAAVSNAGGLGSLAAGYMKVDELRADLDELTYRLGKGRSYGVNVFAPPGHGRDADNVGDYAGALAREATRMRVQLGRPREEQRLRTLEMWFWLADAVAWRSERRPNVGAGPI